MPLRMVDDQKKIFLSSQAMDFDRLLEWFVNYLDIIERDPSYAPSHVEVGEQLSWDAVKEKLKAIIEDEDKHEPLNDDEIVVKLKEQGIEIGRRTVAKYRKILNIAPARQRREF
jgi:DNA-directed RNA polymerase specialized sigma54-like protein